MRTLVSCLTLLLALLAPAIAGADIPPSRTAEAAGGDALIAPSRGGRDALRALARLDPDMDRAIAINTVVAREDVIPVLFAALDLNGDGRLAPEEMARAGGGRRLAWF